MSYQICPSCEKSFKVYPSQKRTYCSRSCMSQGYSKRLIGKGNPNYKNKDKFCIECNSKLSRNSKGDICRKCRNLSGENNPFYGQSHSKESKERMSNNRSDVSGSNNPFYGKRHDEKTLTKLSQLKKEEWRSLSQKEKQKRISNLMKGLETQIKLEYTNPEMIVAEELDKLEIGFEHNAYLYKKFFVDFLIEGGIIIEVFGDYWHGNEAIFYPLNETQKKQKQKDKSRVAYLEKCGHKVIVLWESDLKKDSTIVGDAINDQWKSSLRMGNT